MRDFVPLKGFGAEGTLLSGRDAFFPSPDGRGLKVRDLIQHAFRARFKIPFLLLTRKEFPQGFFPAEVNLAAGLQHLRRCQPVIVERTLLRDEIALVWTIDRSEVVETVYQLVNGNLVLKPEHHDVR